MEEKEDDSWLKDRISCCGCLNILDKPHTLACSHTLCLKCVNGLKMTQQDGKDGYDCPMCGEFCEKSWVRHDYLISVLIECYMLKNKGAYMICKQCKAAKQTRRCIECKIDLCDACKPVHDGEQLMATHHSIPLDAVGQNVTVDNLVLCSKHKHELIQLNCVPCEKPICATCQVTDHVAHPCESTDDALGRILSGVKVAQQEVHDDIKLSEIKRAKLKTKVEEICEHISGLETEVRDAHKRIQERLDTDLASFLQSLNGMKDNAREKEKQCEETIKRRITESKLVTTWLDTTLTAAAGIALLQNLKVGVKETVDNIEESLEHEQTELDTFLFSPFADNALEKELCHESYDMRHNMIGSLKGSYTSQNPPINGNSGLWTIDLKSKFNEEPIKMLSISLDASRYNTTNFSVVKNTLWIPTRRAGKPVIYVYSKTGQYERIIKLAKAVGRPRAVTQWEREEEEEEQTPAVAILASNQGLFTLSQDGELLDIIEHSSFSDVSVHTDHIYALEVAKCEVQVFNPLLQKTKNICINVSCSDLSSAMVIHDGIYLVESIYYQVDRVLKYTKDGKEVAEYGEHGCGDEPAQFVYGRLCGYDSTGTLLLCDENKRLQLLASDGTWHRTSMENLDFDPACAVQADDDSFWILGDSPDYKPTLYLYKFK